MNEIVWIDDLAQCFEEIDATQKIYLDTNTAEFVFVPANQEEWEEYNQEDQDLFYEIDALKQYLPLPNQKELKEYDIMEDYASGCANYGYQKRLLFALKNGKPFRNFRAQIRLLNLEEDYNHYRYMIYCAKARTWCMERNIPYDVDNEEVKEYLREIEEDEKLEKDLEDFEDSYDEFTYEDNDYE